MEAKIEAFQAKLAAQRSVRVEQAAAAAAGAAEAAAEAAAKAKAAAAAAEAEAAAAAAAAAAAEAGSGAAAAVEGDVEDKIEAFQAKLAALQRSVREAQGGAAPDAEQPKAGDE